MKNPNQVYVCVVNIFGTVGGAVISHVRFHHLAVSSYAEAQRQANVVAKEMYEALGLDSDVSTLRTQKIIKRETAANLMTFGHIAAIGERQVQQLQALNLPPAARH